jgi:phosphohistidine phosphatase
VRHLYLLRHAKSSWSDITLADHDRPLSARGARDARRISAWLREHDVAPDVVLCSSSRRTRDTLTPLRKALVPSRTLVERELYGAAEDELLRRLRRLEDDVTAAMLIGHNPGLQQLALVLAGEGADDLLARLAAKFPTAALATLEIPEEAWRTLGEGDAVLVGLVTPKELR